METRADFGSLRPVANTVPHDIDSGPATQTKEEPSVKRGVFGSLIHLLGSCHEVMKEQPQAFFSHQPLPSPGSRPSDLALNSTRLNLFPCRRHPNSKSLPRYLSISSDPSLLPHQKTSWVPRIKIPKFKQPPGPSPLIFRLQPTAAEKTLFLGQPSPAPVSQRLFELHTKVPIKWFPELPQSRGGRDIDRGNRSSKANAKKRSGRSKKETKQDRKPRCARHA